MKRRCFVGFSLVVVLTLVVTPRSSAQPTPQPGAALERREFVIREFRTESSVVLPEARVVYATLGTLNASGDNDGSVEKALKVDQGARAVHAI